jgi:hypothetical protein
MRKRVEKEESYSDACGVPRCPIKLHLPPAAHSQTPQDTGQPCYDVLFSYPAASLRLRWCSVWCGVVWGVFAVRNKGTDTLGRGAGFQGLTLI